MNHNNDQGKTSSLLSLYRVLPVTDPYRTACPHHRRPGMWPSTVNWRDTRNTCTAGTWTMENSCYHIVVVPCFLESCLWERFIIHQEIWQVSVSNTAVSYRFIILYGIVNLALIVDMLSRVHHRTWSSHPHEATTLIYPILVIPKIG